MQGGRAVRLSRIDGDAFPHEEPCAGQVARPCGFDQPEIDAGHAIGTMVE